MFRKPPLSLANFTQQFFDNEVETEIAPTDAYGEQTRKVQDAIKDTYYRLTLFGANDKQRAWANATVQVKRGRKLRRLFFEKI